MNAPMPQSQIPLSIGCEEIAPGIWRFQVRCGPTAQFVDMPRDLLEGILRQSLTKIQQSKTGLVVVPGDALPVARKA